MTYWWSQGGACWFPEIELLASIYHNDPLTDSHKAGASLIPETELLTSIYDLLKVTRWGLPDSSNRTLASIYLSDPLTDSHHAGACLIPKIELACIYPNDLMVVSC